MTPYYQDAAVTIYHGDCREIVPTLGRFDLLLTDPPYGINNHDFRSSLPDSKGTVNSDSIEGDGDTNLARWLLTEIDVADFSVVWGANNFPELLPHKGRWLCWDKRLTEQADKMLGSAFELAWTSKKSGFDKMFRCLHGGVVNANGGKRVHPTEKPITLMSWCIGLAGDAQTILDPFAGSCTTGRAAKDLGRKCVCIEREERYCEIGARRMQQEVLPL